MNIAVNTSGIFRAVQAASKAVQDGAKLSLASKLASLKAKYISILGKSRPLSEEDQDLAASLAQQMLSSNCLTPDDARWFTEHGIVIC